MTDVVVVGAGIVGGAVAFRLASAGLSVSCVDPSDKPTGSASAAAGAMLGAFGEVTAVERRSPGGASQLQLRVRAADGYAAWLEAVNAKAEAEVTLTHGTMVVASGSSRRDRENLEAIRSEVRRLGRSMEDVEPDDVVGLRPHRDHPPAAVVYLPDEGAVDTGALLPAIRRANTATGRVSFVDDIAVSLLGDDRRVTGVETRRSGSVGASWVVLCAGEGIASILSRSPGLSSAVPRIIGGKGTSVVLDVDRPPPHVLRTPNREFACGIHVVPRPSTGGVYVGATNRVASEVGATGRATVGELHLLLEQAMTYIDTRLRRANVRSIAYGSRPLTVDRIPAVGITEVPGLAIASGTYRNGVLLAPLAADLVADEIEAGQRSAENAYSPVGRREPVPAGPDEAAELLRSTASDLVTMLLEPNGTLPAGSAEDLERFLEFLLPLAVGSDQREAMERFQRLLDDHPIEEIVPELFVVAASMMRPSSPPSRRGP